MPESQDDLQLEILAHAILQWRVQLQSVRVDQQFSLLRHRVLYREFRGHSIINQVKMC